ncbi:multimeric flavodoxin WrbA [Elusimicrobium posterum]|uniref:flavodoxin family protein n=1 Tax=Elusimicrobium posterum TaxID=3116653 RepID=UPI003C71385F
MKIIGLSASPRKEGNTAWAVNKILESAAAQGAQTQMFHFSDLNINPCKGCLACIHGEKRCVVNDDMQKIYAALKEADALVLGSPVYMGQMSAQAKIFTDRLFAQITPRFSPHFKEENAGKKMILLFTQGNPKQDLFKEYFDYTKKMFGLLEFDVKGMHIITGMRTEAACEQKDLPEQMKEAALSLFK